MPCVGAPEGRTRGAARPSASLRPTVLSSRLREKTCTDPCCWIHIDGPIDLDPLIWIQKCVILDKSA